MCSSDLAAAAAQRAMAAADIEPRDVDLLIFASASHDVAEPATANMVQIAFGCDRAAVMDVKNACNSFLNGLDVAQAFIETGPGATRVVVAAGECLSPTIKWNIAGSDELPVRLAALTLGDAGAACVLEASAAPERGLLRGRVRIGRNALGALDGARRRLALRRRSRPHVLRMSQHEAATARRRRGSRRSSATC